VVDKFISGNEAIVIVQLRFNLEEVPAPTSRTEELLYKYFGTWDFQNQTFEQERKFLFRLYESGTWRVENEERLCNQKINPVSI
jgi:uncharacterized FlgJ-related protein